MKRILFILPMLNVGGLERVQVTLANKLAQSGYDVTVMTLGEGDELRPQLDSRVHFVYKPLKPHPFMKRIPYIRNKLYDDGMWETRASAQALHDYYVGNEHFDVEIGFFRGLSIKIVSGCRDKSVVRLAWVHNDFEKAVGYKNNFKSVKQVFNAYRAYNSVVCVSNQAKQGFIKTIGDTGNLTTVYNMLPIDEIIKNSNRVSDKNVKRCSFHTVVVARLDDGAKGQKRLINAVANLHNEGYDVSLAVVGGGADEKMLQDEISKCGAQDYITMTGSQINPYPYIREADLLVCSSYFEGYNLTVAEALIIGTPVLSTDCTGPNEILDRGRYGMIVENSEQGIYDGIKRLIADKTLYDNYKKATAERRGFFDEAKLLKQVTDLFENDEC